MVLLWRGDYADHIGITAVLQPYYCYSFIQTVWSGRIFHFLIFLVLLIDIQTVVAAHKYRLLVPLSIITSFYLSTYSLMQICVVFSIDTFAGILVCITLVESIRAALHTVCGTGLALLVIVVWVAGVTRVTVTLASPWKVINIAWYNMTQYNATEHNITWCNIL